MNKKKAVIITIYDPNPNMGNRLQNYAVQTVLQNMELETVSIAFRKCILNKKTKIKLAIHKMTNYRFTSNTEFWKLMPGQIKAFNQFNDKYIKTLHIKDINDIPQADFYVLGSDQIWNPQWWNTENPYMEKNIYFATFAKAENIVCFSPSFGKSDIPDEWISWFRRNLHKIDKLTVREEEGRQIIKRLTRKEALVTIDPTLMIEAPEWDKIADMPQNIDINKNYILTYFLGGRSKKIDEDIKNYAEQLNAEVYYLFDRQYTELFFVNPSEFLTLIKNARLILTDSFHACVFSFIYQKPFLVYEREDAKGMMSRINTLLQKFHLERKYINSGLKNDLLECEYEDGYKILEIEREKLQKYLQEAFIK